MGSLPLGVVSLIGNHPNFIFCYDRKPSFFAVSSIFNKAALGIKIRLPILILGIVPHRICSYVVPRPMRKSLATSMGVSTSESFPFPWLFICSLIPFWTDCYFAYPFVSPGNRNGNHIVQLHKDSNNWLPSFFLVVLEPVGRDNDCSTIPNPDQFPY